MTLRRMIEHRGAYHVETRESISPGWAERATSLMGKEFQDADLFPIDVRR
jgi:hypothetical protein